MGDPALSPQKCLGVHTVPWSNDVLEVCRKHAHHVGSGNRIISEKINPTIPLARILYTNRENLTLMPNKIMEYIIFWKIAKNPRRMFKDS